ncbi:MAG TPA: TIGR02757 family protein [Bacteroidales bacterium]|nr:TIGR02757 family protein [Bacteroidales bacterium]
MNKPYTAGALKELLDQKAAFYNRPFFIDTDPVSVPHRFSRKEDIEIAAFLVASIAWGNRKAIIGNGLKLMERMDWKPFDFVRSFSENDLKPFSSFVHRTFNFSDLSFFLFSLKNIYENHGGLEHCFTINFLRNGSVKEALTGFRKVFFEIPHLPRTLKHVSNPDAGASAKRLNMFLRWMVRQDAAGVDFGLWKTITPHRLMCPLDVHSGRVARHLGLLQRKQDDWKAVEELTRNLGKLNPADPVLYDFALFGMGVFERNGSHSPERFLAKSTG